MLELSLESYSKLTDGIEAKLDEADFVAENETRRYSHDEVFQIERKDKWIILITACVICRCFMRN